VPFTRTRFESNGTRNTEYHYLPVERGYLMSAAVSTNDANSYGATVFACITVEQTSESDHLVIATLCKGYIGLDNPIGWTGKLNLEDSMRVTLTTISEDLLQIDLGIITEV